MAAKQNHRSPADITLRHGHATHRDAIWAAIRQMGKFTINDIEHHVNGEKAGTTAQDKRPVSRDTITTYVCGLTAAGYLKRIEGQSRAINESGRYTKNRWQLVRDVGIDAPRVTRNGKLVTQGRGRTNMWRAMKIIKEFNWRELHAHASTEEHPISLAEAKDYIGNLARAGYLHCTAPSRPGTPARYRLIPARYTGPKPPQVQRVNQVYDPNLGKVVWYGGDA